MHVALHELDGPVDRGADLLGEPQPHLLDLGRLAGDDDDLARPAADRADEAQHGLRVHPVRVEHLAVLDARRDVLLVGLHHVERARLAALAADVDEDQRVVAAHDLVGEVEAAGAEVHHAHAGGQLAPFEALDDLAAEAVVAQPGVADAGHEDLLLERLRHVPHTSSSPRKKKW